jgi:hypothetical protein
MKTYLVILASVLLIAGIIGVYAADTAPVKASVTVPGTLSITSASGLSFPPTTTSGGTVADTLDLVVDSNEDYIVEVKSNADYFTKDGNNTDTTVADSALEGKNEALAWVPYSQVYAQLDSGSGSGTHNIDHQVTVPGVAGLYELDITVKVTA